MTTLPHIFETKKATPAGVRGFVADDVFAVADLHRRVNGVSDAEAAKLIEPYRLFFADVFLPAGHPIAGVGSLVYQEADGAVVGFQGVHARRMVFEDRPVMMAVCSHFVVDPARRGVPGIQLLKRLMDGPQDLTIADESNDTARRLWEWCGGTTTLLYSMHWMRPLRVAEAGLKVLLSKKSPRVARAIAPIARKVDALCDRFGVNALRTFKPKGSREILDEATLMAKLPEFTGGRSLRPDYADGSLSWILQRARTRNVGGEFRQIAVKDERGEIAGWFLYFANRGGVAEVLQIGARRNSVGLVLDHLIEDGMQSGVIALSGRLDPDIAPELSERHSLFYRRGHWALVHSRLPKILHAIERGDAFLSRLEGEFCLRFQ